MNAPEALAEAETMPAPVASDVPSVRGSCGVSVKEPTTAEAFATAEACMGSTAREGQGLEALALLKRRMGAVAQAVAEFDAACKAAGGPKGLSMGEEEALARLLAAITDAPPAFTLEEVSESLLRAGADADAIQSERERLAALRR